MKKITQLLFSLSMVLLLSCSGGTYVASNDGGISGTGNGGSQSSIAGSAYKGPFVQDSEVNVFKVDGDSSALISNAQVQANLGDFIVEVEPGLLSVATTGRFYDETTATFSDDSVTLKALVNKLPDQQALIFINVLTLLSHDDTIERINLGHSFEQANNEAQEKVKTFLAALTGEIPTSEPFTNMNIINTLNTTPQDNAYSLYVSSLFSEAVHIQRLEEPHYSMTTLLSQLRSDLINNLPLNETTLRTLQEAHANLDAETIQLNLQALYVDANVPPLSDVIAIVSPGLEGPENLTAYYDAEVAIQRLCFDMMSTCSQAQHTDEITRPESFNYEIQLDDQNDFSSPTISEANWPINFFDIEAESLGSGEWYFRVRKQHASGQYSVWEQIDFILP